MSIMLKYLGATCVVVAAMMYAITATHMGMVICQ